MTQIIPYIGLKLRAIRNGFAEVLVTNDVWECTRLDYKDYLDCITMKNLRTNQEQGWNLEYINSNFFSLVGPPKTHQEQIIDKINESYKRQRLQGILM